MIKVPSRKVVISFWQMQYIHFPKLLSTLLLLKDCFPVWYIKHDFFSFTLLWMLIICKYTLYSNHLWFLGIIYKFAHFWNFSYQFVSIIYLLKVLIFCLRYLPQFIILLFIFFVVCFWHIFNFINIFFWLLSLYFGIFLPWNQIHIHLHFST